MIIGRSLAPLNSSRTLRAVPRRGTGCLLSDDNSRRKAQNVREDSSADWQLRLRLLCHYVRFNCVDGSVHNV